MTSVHHDMQAAVRRSAADAAATNSPSGNGPPATAMAALRQAGLDGPRVLAAVAEVVGVPYWEGLAQRPASAEFLARVPIGFARRHKILGLAGANGEVRLAMSDLADWQQVAVVARLLGRQVQPVLATEQEILSAVNAAYQQQDGKAQEVIGQLDRGQVLGQVQALSQSEDLLDVASRAPVIQLVNLVLFEAVKLRASDVHVQPYEDRLVIRFRIDGLLYDRFQPPKALQEEILSRIKVMGRMNIAEKRLAQDGRATVQVGDRVVDLRIATLPTSFGERAVIRLLDKSIRLYRLGELGMNEHTLGLFGSLIAMDHGIILVTGPTGSGKTTTLYAAIQELNAKELNILTLEDPIEYRLEGISQTQTNEKKGMTFASGLRHVLRQDPDVIMVGEIRDTETARMAIQSALTGHLVFSTLHTNDAASAVARLLDLGAEPYLVASSLIGVLAQRLVRRVCPNCRRPHRPSEADWRRWKVDPSRLALAALQEGAGCEHCLKTGYRDRVGIFELLAVDEAIGGEIVNRARASAIKRRALEAGMQTLRQDGMAKAAAGVTTIDEVVRVTARSEA